MENKIQAEHKPLCASTRHAKELQLDFSISPFDIINAIANSQVCVWWKIGLFVVWIAVDIASLHT